MPSSVARDAGMRVVFLAHVKDISLEKDGAEVSTRDIDLTGRLKRIVTSQSDAIGFLYRGKPNENILSFLTTDDVTSGARSKHLSNAEILISTAHPKTKVVTSYWEKVFIDEPSSK